ncbi:Acyl-CoA synthetase (AMP-forming)/AMP-acid ligase II [Aliiroseovarius halocynthiae]|uniref:AMP-binding protein n=1 Tax=Aliiroseovarius halocynthiae TaxID=985055 RepID=A0A545SRF3_9RHOB|nr:AMP-binding protein [Aliiroseovarius halocynthiae]TQV67476.1 AMP-binding protein [Aliiroseovarius halocynthiae]SMR81484.1 Acyl-CoA synthetase (AMP-forming)/AMP-acid ligase II [Aliiroseovarius halocynthiae]
MTLSRTIAEELVRSIHKFSDRCALSDTQRQISYARLGQYVSDLNLRLHGHQVIGIFGAPGLAMSASAVACVIHGRPFVHLDPAMPQMVLHNILSELKVSLVITCEGLETGQLPRDCITIEAKALLAEAPAAHAPIFTEPVLPTDPIYLVATSGTTGRPKCIPVSQDAAFLSYEWRDTYTPYTPDTRVGIYVFAIWEMLRPLRKGASLWFPDAGTLFAPANLADFLIQNSVDEMLFTPSFYGTFLNALPADKATELPLSRVILNGEVVNDDLIAASLRKLPNAALWNLYSICETHDICISQLTSPTGDAPASVGIPMQHLRAVILDESEIPCPIGTSGQLYFEGPRMLGQGYVNRPEETRLRFREMTIEGREVRLYDTGDQAKQTEDGTLYIEGRIAHMLKLRGFSIQTRELTDTMRERLGFSSAAPWVAEVGERGQSLIFYFAADTAQAARNATKWGLEFGINRIPATLAAELREALPHYCIPSYLVQMDALPLHPVSGKADVRALPQITDTLRGGHSEDAVILAAARALACAPADIDPALSFHAQGGDSLMCVNLMLDLENTYGLPIDFDLAMNVPLHRIDQLLTQEADAASPVENFDRPGILLTGATGFLGGHVLAQAARGLPEDEIVYCLVRDKNRSARDRLDQVAKTFGVAHSRYVIVHGTLDAPYFGLARESYSELGQAVTKVVHCAAMVNLAIGRQEMLDWSARGMTTVLEFCRDAQADLRFTSSTAVFPDRGGPWPEGLTPVWEGCTGYGAAKIAAEDTIRASGISSAIVRLPSLYDLNTANQRDIYEIILAASFNAAHMPKGLAFPMVDVTAAAAFLLGDIATSEAPIYNLLPDQRITPQSPHTLETGDWLDAVELDAGIKKVISEFPDTMCADARFENAAARAAWKRISDKPFESISDSETLLTLRQKAYQGEPALTSKSDIVKARAASLAK